METLLTILVLVILSALSSWLKKRGETEDAEPLPGPSQPPDRSRVPRTPTRPAPGGPASPRPTIPRSWEDELRRLLEGEPVQPPELPQPPPATGPTPRLPPILTPPPPPPPAPAPDRAETTAVPRAEALQRIDIRDTAAQRLEAQELLERATAQLRAAEKAVAARAPSRAYPGRTRAVSKEIAAVRSRLAHPTTAREVVIASVILSPPAGL